MDKKSNIVFSLLIILLIYFFISGAVWVMLHKAYPTWDAAEHTRQAVEYSLFFSSLINGNVSDISSLLTSPYGPLLKVLTGLLMVFTGASTTIAGIASLLYAIAAFYGIFLFVRELTGKPMVALLAVLLFSHSLLVLDNSRMFLLDIPLTGIIAYALYFFIKSKYLTIQTPATYFFVWLAVGALVKVQALFYVGLFIALHLPFIWQNRLRVFAAIKTGLLVFFVLIAPWVFVSLPRIIDYFIIAFRPEIGDPVTLTSLDTWVFYTRVIINHLITAPVLLIALIGLVFAPKEYHAKLWAAYVYALIGYVLITLYPNKDIRYMLPVYLMWVVACALGLYAWQMRLKTAGIVLCFAVAAYMVFLNLANSFNIPPLKGVYKFIYVPVLKDVAYANISAFPVRLYDIHKEPLPPLVRVLSQEVKRLGAQKVHVLVLVNYDTVNSNTILLESRLQKATEIFTKQTDGVLVFPTQQAADAWADNFKYAVITTSTDPGVAYQVDKAAYIQLIKRVNDWLYRDVAQVIGEYPLKTGGKLLLIKRDEVKLGSFDKKK